MARRTTKARLGMPKMDVKVREEIVAEVLRVLLPKEIVVSVRAPFATSVLRPDNTFRMEPIQPEMELLFKGMRLGQREPFVFEFEPIGASEFKQVEFEETKLFQAIPKFETTLVNALGYYDDISWTSAKMKFLEEAEKRIEAAKELERLAALERQQKDDLWGVF